MKIKTLDQIDESQLDQLMIIWLAGNLQAHHFVSAAFWRQNIPAVRAALPTAEITVALNDADEMIGFMGIQENYLAGLFVMGKYQNQGVGHALLATAQRQYPSLTLDAFQQNKGAVRFYRRHGFEVTEQRLAEDTQQVEYQMSWHN